VCVCVRLFRSLSLSSSSSPHLSHTHPYTLFTNTDAAFVIANAILMLNTSLHNPRIKSKDRITCSQFVNMCKHVDGSNYTEKDLEDVCVCIRVCVCVYRRLYVVHVCVGVCVCVVFVRAFA